MIPLLVGLAGLIGGALIVAYWDEIVDWLSDLIPKIKNVMRSIAHAAAMFAQKIKNAYAKIMHKLYYKENKQWIEETTTRTIPESEVPASIRAKISTQEQDVTREVENELNLELNN